MLGSEGSIDPRPWPRVVCAGMVINDAGLAFRDGPLLSRMVDGILALAENRERVTALLSVAYRRPMPEASIDHIDADADYWRRGDKALANLRLVFAGLPRLEDAGDLARLHAAERLLDQGLAPRVLMKELGLDPAAPNFRKYDPDQPRVPAGHGRESGRWGDDAGISDPPRPQGANLNSGPHRVQVAANGPLTPGGTIAVPSPEIDPLDPMGLNKEPPTPQEQQAIVDTLQMIQSGNSAEIKRLDRHPYQNLPHYKTGAMLPPAIGRYTSSNVRLPGGVGRGEARLVLDSESDQAYYTNNHYFSFYKVDLNRNP